MYHYFTGLDFRWCKRTLCESSRIVKLLSLGVLDMDGGLKEKESRHVRPLESSNNTIAQSLTVSDLTLYNYRPVHTYPDISESATFSFRIQKFLRPHSAVFKSNSPVYSHTMISGFTLVPRAPMHSKVFRACAIERAIVAGNLLCLF